jgi:hypothetical protein
MASIQMNTAEWKFMCFEVVDLSDEFDSSKEGKAAPDKP